MTDAQCRALFVAARRIIQWRDRDEGLIEAMAEIPANEEREFSEETDIYGRLRDALAFCGWRAEVSD